MRDDSILKQAQSFLDEGLFDQAEDLLRSILLLRPDEVEVVYMMSMAQANLGNLELANDYLTRAIALDENHEDSIYSKGRILLALGRHKEAMGYHNRALLSQPNNIWAYLNRANSLSALGDYELALKDCDRLLELDPKLPAGLSIRANVLKSLQRYEESLRDYDEAIALDPEYAEAWSNRGVVLNDLKQYEKALISFDTAISLRADYAEALSNRSVALNQLRRHTDSLASISQAVAIQPRFPEAWNNLGVTFHYLKRYSEAITSYDRAITLRADYAEAWANRGFSLIEAGLYEAAIESYTRAIELNPYIDFALDFLIYSKMTICDWSALDVKLQALEEGIRSGGKVSMPFPLLGLFDDPCLHKVATQNYVKSKLGVSSALGPIPKLQKRQKIRVAYFSMDFREHPVARLLAELIESHNRKKFEVLGFSFGENTQDLMRQRLERSFDGFFDVQNLDEIEIAKLSRKLNVDIAIDLGGHTKNSRPKIFSYRAAPIQINYLGYPGTMGMSEMDYLVADPVLVPEAYRQNYSEKLIVLPNCYQANDTKRRISEAEFTYEELGLSKTGVVFCCFSSNWKILPDVFDSWMRILIAVENSVLWLFEDNSIAASNLRKRAVLRGVDADRIVFARRMENERHLARYRYVDLFLDTYPYNAHTTASDALWIGAPVLTLKGRSFAAGVAASLLKSVGLEDLVTSSAEEYEARAVSLGSNPPALSALKERLVLRKQSAPLFNMALLSKDLESAYKIAYDRYHQGLPADTIIVDSD